MSSPAGRWPIVARIENWVRVQVDPSVPAMPCRANNLALHHGDECVVEIPDGQFFARATLFAPPVLAAPVGLTGRVVRLATDEDRAHHEAALALEAEIDRFVRARVRELALDVRPLKARQAITGRGVIVLFTAEQRVDFRPLLRDLSREFRRRIEMRPLGVRDGAKVTGGLGPCGRPLCCTTFMDRFHSVTVRMAKRQNLSLNPTKISGMCGRLMCCLAHEADQYPAPQRRRRQPDEPPA